MAESAETVVPDRVLCSTDATLSFSLLLRPAGSPEADWLPSLIFKKMNKEEIEHRMNKEEII